MILQDNIIDVWQIELKQNQKDEAHAALQQILHHYLPNQPLPFEFTRNENGKPRLQTGTLQFNLSHSHDVALIAVTKSRQVGIDVQKIKAETTAVSLAQRFFSPREASEIIALPDTEKLSAFFKMWARKEAFIKAKGTRLADLKLDLAKVMGWGVHDLKCGKDYVAAVAAQGNGWGVNTISPQAHRDAVHHHAALAKTAFARHDHAVQSDSHAGQHEVHK